MTDERGGDKNAARLRVLEAALVDFPQGHDEYGVYAKWYDGLLAMLHTIDVALPSHVAAPTAEEVRALWNEEREKIVNDPHIYTSNYWTVCWHVVKRVLAARSTAAPINTATPERRSSPGLSEVKPDANEGRSGEVDREGGGSADIARSDAVGAGRAECGSRAPGREADSVTGEGVSAPSSTAATIPQEIQEWLWHLELHLTEHDERHAGLALRAAWPHVRDYLASIRGTLIQLQNRAAPSATGLTTPIQMVLHCPACGLQHVDAPEWPGLDEGEQPPEEPRWKNPPHRSHLCHGCGAIWRPADVETNGVKAIRTRGKADTWPLPEFDSSLTDGRTASSE